MPFTATNGVFTVLYVTFSGMERELALNILNYGGVGGWYIVESSQMQALIEQYQYLKSVPQILAMFLTLNIAIVGLAFIFELIRNLFLGGQSFGGTGGVSLAATREIRSEGEVQGRLLYFAFAGFSGYTVLLVVLACYKEFGSLMPFTTWLESNGFDEGNRLLTTWMFIAALEQGEKNWGKSSNAYLEAIKVLPNQSLLKIQAAVVLWMSGKKDQANDFFLET